MTGRRTVGLLAQRTMLALGSNGVNIRKMGCMSYRRSLDKFWIRERQVGQESNLHPAVVETPSDAHGLKTSKLAIWLKLVWVL
jgi:hypothetical protein